MEPWLGEDQDWRPQACMMRQAGMSVGGGDAGLPRAVETLSSLDVAGRLLPVVPAGGSSPVGSANPAGPDGPVVAGGPVGLCGTLSPLFHGSGSFGSGSCWPSWPICCCWPCGHVWDAVPI